MEKSKSKKEIIDEIINGLEEVVKGYKNIAAVAEIVIAAIKELKVLVFPDSDESSSEPAAKRLFDPNPTKEVKTYTFEEVRGTIAALCSSGKKAEALELIHKYGATHLSDVKQEDYAELMADAEVLKYE